MIYAVYESDDQYSPEDLAPSWMLNLIDERMMFARLPDHITNDVRVRLSGDVTVEQASEILVLLDQYIDKDFRSSKFINKRVARMVNDETK